MKHEKDRRNDSKGYSKSEMLIVSGVAMSA
jgi:hypothetical protein